ncbi:MAG TPA: Gfo/Idh/MocA family oxidoreductase [Bryobacteraceae bacterium]|jgi:predicted dehydrogenase|nr:Gfo/Idh/MocA family oxidoreductase [Bryobacteraceae bacterium]
MASTRRHFLQAGGAASLALGAARGEGTTAANDKIRFATIGCGIMGQGDTGTAISVPGTQLVAVCDVYEGRLTRAKEHWGASLATTRDYREVLARKDVDAVIIATPDHWHARIAAEAMEAGKDVYVQKPMVKHWQDGHRLIETSRRTRRILQVGSQRVSSVIYKKARELYRAGAIGTLNAVEAWIDRNSAVGAWRYSIPPDAGPATIDWDRFLGDAPKRPFDAQRLFQWRNWSDYGTGVAGDLFVHLFSGIHFVLDSTGPARAFAGGGIYFWKGDRDAPDILVALYDYPRTDSHPAFNLALRVNFVCGGPETSRFHFTGSEGVMTIGDGVTLSKPPKETEPGESAGGFSRETAARIMVQHHARYVEHPVTAATMPEFGEEQFLAPRGYSDDFEHHTTFFNAVRSRQPVVEDATFGLRAAGPALLANLSYEQNRIQHWDPVAMQLAEG